MSALFSRPAIRCFSSENLPVLTLFTKRKEHCSLCEVAKNDIEPFKSKFIYKEIFIDDPENTEWYRKYRYEIPVIHVNGEFAMKHRVDVPLLQKILQK